MKDGFFHYPVGIAVNDENVDFSAFWTLRFTLSIMPKRCFPLQKYLRHCCHGSTSSHFFLAFFWLFKLRHSLFVIKAIIEFRQRSDEDEAFMYSKSSWSNWSRHCVTACLVSLLVLRTYHVTFESSIELVCRSSMHLMAGVPLGFQSLHVTMSHRFRKLTLHSCLCMRQLHSQMGRIQEEKGRLHFTYIDPCLNINEKS